MTQIPLSPEQLGDIMHALGRPKNPLVESYRNYYATDVSDKAIASLVDLGMMIDRGPYANSGDLHYFEVTKLGRKTAASYLSVGK